MANISTLFTEPSTMMPAVNTGRAMLVTPELANKFLASNTRNRRVKDYNLKRIARAIVGGRWKLNGEAIVVTTDGRVVDGQHRLKAIASTGIPVWTFVNVIKDDTGIFESIDTGSLRSASDALTIRGFKYEGALGSAALWLYFYINQVYQSSKRPDNTQVLAVVQANPSLVDSVNKTCTDFKPSKMFVAPSVVAVCHYLESRVDSERANTFFERLTYGENLKQGEPEYMLRQALINARTRGGGNLVSRHWSYALTLKALSAANIGKEMHLLRWNPRNEEMPMLLDKEGLPVAVPNPT